MGLTLRQRAFLDKLIDLYHDNNGPVHYSVLAQKLGVNRFSAYDMLKSLESKGLVGSEYVLDDNSGPGRSSVVFFPLDRARRVLARWTGAEESKEWEEAKQRIMADLQAGHLAREQLLDELIQAIPETSSPLAFCARALTALALYADTQLDNVGQRLDTLIGTTGKPEEPNLDLLAGFTLGLSLPKAPADLIAPLVSFAQRYQERLKEIDQEGRRRLADFLREVAHTLDSG